MGLGSRRGGEVGKEVETERYLEGNLRHPGVISFTDSPDSGPLTFMLPDPAKHHFSVPKEQIYKSQQKKLLWRSLEAHELRNHVLTFCVFSWKLHSLTHLFIGKQPLLSTIWHTLEIENEQNRRCV